VGGDARALRVQTENRQAPATVPLLPAVTLMLVANECQVTSWPGNGPFRLSFRGLAPGGTEPSDRRRVDRWHRRESQGTTLPAAEPAAAGLGASGQRAESS